MKLNPIEVFGQLIGASVVYLGFVIIDWLITHKFDPVFFFVYWDLMLVVILISAKVKSDMKAL